jgi:hypothetical protein
MQVGGGVPLVALLSAVILATRLGDTQLSLEVNGNEAAEQVLYMVTEDLD